MAIEIEKYFQQQEQKSSNLLNNGKGYKDIFLQRS